MAGAHVADHVIGKNDDEGSEDDDLEDKTSHGDIDAQVTAVVTGRHSTTGGLEDKADNIEGDEDPVEQLRLKSRQLRSEEVDRLGEGDVDRGRVEDGSDGQADCDS